MSVSGLLGSARNLLSRKTQSLFSWAKNEFTRRSAAAGRMVAHADRIEAEELRAWNEFYAPHYARHKVEPKPEHPAVSYCMARRLTYAAIGFFAPKGR